MKRYVIVGIAVVAILGIVISMALINNTALADKSDTNGSFLFNATDSSTTDEQAVAPAAAEVDLVGDTAVSPNGFGNNFIDEDGDGVCDTCGSVPGTGTGDNFIDEDGDGICDICGNVLGTGTGNHNGNGSGGDNFIDEDGDGVCDDCGTAPADGTGNQYGRRNGNGGQGNRGGQGTSAP